MIVDAFPVRTVRRVFLSFKNNNHHGTIIINLTKVLYDRKQTSKINNEEDFFLTQVVPQYALVPFDLVRYNYEN